MSHAMRQSVSVASNRSNQTTPTEDSLSTAKEETVVIAVFGAHGVTGSHFVRLALDAGYHCRVMAIDTENLPSHPSCTHIPTETPAKWYQDAKSIRHVVRGAHFVVCLLAEKFFTNENKQYVDNAQSRLVHLIYKAMRKEKTGQVFLFQASSLAPSIQGSMPLFAKVIKKVAAIQKSTFIKDQDAVVKEIAEQHSPQRSSDGKQNLPAPFSYIVTRPTFLLRDGPSTRKLAASRSAPGPMPVSHLDLAEFSLNALRNGKLFNSCPYVVADSF